MTKKTPDPPETAFVLDGSIVLAWFFEDETDPYADSVQDAFPARTAVVPALWPLEVANVLTVGERRKRTTEAMSTRFITLLSALPIVIDTETAARAWGDTIRIARARGLSVYDAAYLELAVRTNFPLATLDNQLKEAGQAVGISLYCP